MADPVRLEDGESASYGFDFRNDPVRPVIEGKDGAYAGALFSVRSVLDGDDRIMATLTVPAPSGGQQSVATTLIGPKDGSTFSFFDLFSEPLPPELAVGTVMLTAMGGEAEIDRFSLRLGTLDNDVTAIVNVLDVTAVPLPAGAWLMLGALGALGLAARRGRG